MKCEIKYILHDMTKIVKTMPLKWQVMGIILAVGTYYGANTLFPGVGWMVVWAVSMFLFVALYYNEVKEYCKNKDN